MKRMTKAEMKRRHLLWLVIGVGSVAIGIFVFVGHFVFPHPSYEELQTREAVVESVEYKVDWSRYYTRRYYRVTMSNGERYITCGSEVRKLEEKLHPGDLVTIKYHGTSIDELKKGEELLVTYVDYYENGKIFVSVISVVFLIGGLFFVNIYSLCFKNDIRIQENRDKRIKKKYGDQSKIK